MVKRKTLEETVTTTTTTTKKINITGTIFYAHVKEPNNKPNKSGYAPSGKYELDLSIGPTTKKTLEDLGVQVLNKGDQKGDYVRVRSINQPTLIMPDGTKFSPLTMTEDGDEIAGDTYPLIGNGSMGSITGTLYDNIESNVKAGRGGKKLLGLGTITLTKFVPFEDTLVISEDGTSGT